MLATKGVKKAGAERALEALVANGSLVGACSQAVRSCPSRCGSEPASHFASGHRHDPLLHKCRCARTLASRRCTSQIRRAWQRSAPKNVQQSRRHCSRARLHAESRRRQSRRCDEVRASSTAVLETERTQIEAAEMPAPK